MKTAPIAALLLLIGAIHNHTHKIVPPEHAAMVWNLTGAALHTVLIAIVAWAYRTSPAVLLACSLLGGWSLQVAGCSAAWIVQPWALVEGGELCSDRLGLPFGLFALVATCLVASYIGRRN